MQNATTRQTIEIQYHDAFSSIYGLLACLGIGFINQNVFRARHPFQKTREVVGNHHLSLMSTPPEKRCHCQYRTYGIAIWIDMTSQNKMFRSLYDSIKAFKKGVSLHNFNKACKNTLFSDSTPI